MDCFALLAMTAEVALLAHPILPPPLRPERTGRTLPAAITPLVPCAAFAEIAGVGVLADEIDQPLAACWISGINAA